MVQALNLPQDLRKETKVIGKIWALQLESAARNRVSGKNRGFATRERRQKPGFSERLASVPYLKLYNKFTENTVDISKTS
ncbi:hypothetical protein MiSe_62260 [Microseira wollei NIES-4236]|uniref:Transposase n=1 Tax=Microseira wollei NIES-4236 TaxID=2530354 RepID=A0AAV3XL95_9CYAN|nr:hypothetical protein MiSe_62260 [Microseira wollei NIES-4236]